MKTLKEYLNEQDPCWKGYQQIGMKKKNGKEVPNCVPEEIEEEDIPSTEYLDDTLSEEEKKNVTLNKPFRTPGESRKFAVYVKNPAGKTVIVRFGDPDMEIKRDDPARRKSFRARHKCDTASDKTTPRYWSCHQWRANSKVED